MLNDLEGDHDGQVTVMTCHLLSQNLPARADRHETQEEDFTCVSPAANIALMQRDTFIYVRESVILPLHHWM